MHRRNHRYRFDSVRFSSSGILAALLLVTLPLTLSNDTFAAPTNTLLIGRVLAGETPIKNATVTLFATVNHPTPIFAGTYSEPVAETHTDEEGRFSFDLSTAHASLMIARSMEGPLMRVEEPPLPGSLYLISRGGNANGADNPAITLAAALGTPPPQGRVTISELTTVVAAFSVGYVFTEQWFTGSNQWNGRASFPMAVFSQRRQTSHTDRDNTLDLSGGTPSDESLALACQLVDSVSGRLQPVFSRGANSPALVNTLADILHSCVMSRAPGFAECRSLFQGATLPDPWNFKPENTLTAIESIVSKLGRNNSALMRLLASERPFTPVLEQAPKGWLLSLNFRDLGLHRPTAILADPSDRTLWVLNSGTRTLTELSTEPKDFTNPPLGSRKVPAAVRDKPVDFWFARSYESYYQSGTRPQTTGWFSKPSVWIAGGKFLFLNADGTTCASRLRGLELKGARGLSGNTMWGERIFVANTDADEVLILKQPKERCDSSELADRLKPPFGSAVPEAFLANPAHVVACPRFLNAWFTNVRFSSVSALYYYNCQQPLQGTPFFGGGLSDPEGLDCDNDGDVWIANNADQAKSVSELETLPDPATLQVRPPCLDGGDPGQANVTKVAALSPSNGFSGADLNRPYGVAVDQLGNVWVTNEGNDSLTVFIGAGGVPAGGRIYTGG